MLISYETTKTVDEVRQTLEEKAKEKGFGVMAVHDVSKVLENKGVPISYRCVVVEVCSPKHASQMLSVDANVSTTLPCRIAIYEKDGKTVLATVAPTEMFSAFGRQELEPVAKEVETLIKQIMEESL